MVKIFDRIIYLIIIFFITGVSCAQEPILGVVVNIADGDTVTVWEKKKQYKIRLHGVDTPEKKQNFGMKAKKFTSNMVFQKQVKIVSYDKGKYGRTIGI